MDYGIKYDKKRAHRYACLIIIIIIIIVDQTIFRTLIYDTRCNYTLYKIIQIKNDISPQLSDIVGCGNDMFFFFREMRRRLKSLVARAVIKRMRARVFNVFHNAPQLYSDYAFRFFFCTHYLCVHRNIQFRRFNNIVWMR